jgi:hypothetical protein
MESKEMYNLYKPYLKEMKNLEREVKTVFHLIDYFYDNYDSSHVAPDALKSIFETLYINSREKDTVFNLISEATHSEVDHDLARDILEWMLEEQKSQEIIRKLMPVAGGDKHSVLETISDDIDKFTKLMRRPPSETEKLRPVSLTVDQVIEEVIMDRGLPFHLPTLNEVIGGIRRGSHGVIYGYVDCGKTSFALSLLASLASHIEPDELILYLGNEEKAQRRIGRFMHAINHANNDWIIENREQAIENTESVGYYGDPTKDKIHFFDGIKYFRDIRNLVEEYLPAYVFIDQAQVVEIGKKNVEGPGKLELLFREYRDLSTEFDIGLVDVVQGTGKSEDKKWLGLSDMYNSKVAIQSTVDWAVGIGKLEEAAKENIRYINVPKNKYGTGKQFVTYFHKEMNVWTEA